MSEYPKMLYRPAAIDAESTVEVEGLTFETLIVEDADAEDDAEDDGFAEFADRDTSGALTGELHGDASLLASASRATLASAESDALTERAEAAERNLETANGTISTLRTEISLANQRIETLEAEKVDLAAKLAKLDQDGDGKPGGSVAQEPPALTGKNKADLLDIAAKEGVTVEDGATNPQIVDAIEAKREAHKAV